MAHERRAVTGWCPRCDAVRERATACPVCGTPLAMLDAAHAGPAPAPPPDAAPVEPPPAPPRTRAALALAAVVLAGIAFVAGRAGGPPARPAGPAATTVPTSTTPAGPANQRRRLGWSASRGGITLTAVAIERGQEPGVEETIGQLDLRVDGLARGQRVLAFADLRLRDTAGGLFASPDRNELAGTDGAETFPAGDDERSYVVLLGPTPPASQLATIEVGGLVVGRIDEPEIRLDTPTPWAARAEPVSLGRDAVEVLPGPSLDGPLRLEVTAAFVGGGRATAVIAVKPTEQGQSVTGILPVTAELRAGGRTLCRQTEVVSGTQTLPGPGLVVSCPTAPTDRLTVGMGIGVEAVPLRATLAQPGVTTTTGG